MLTGSQPFPFERLRRFPGVEAANLYASDASDVLILDEAADVLRESSPGTVAVVGDRYGALTLGAAAIHGLSAIRVSQDDLSGEQALANNAAALGLTDTFSSHDLGSDLLTGASIVLMQLPRELAALDEITENITRYARDEVRVFAGGRVKHMTGAQSSTLRLHFRSVQASLARQKSRVLTASRPEPASQNTDRYPRRQFHADLGLWICAHGGAFGGTKVDIGTRFLLGFVDQMRSGAVTAIDLGCGTGLVAAALATRRPGLHVIATDQSSAAVKSAAATAAANHVEDRVTVVRDDAMGSLPAATSDLVVCNPPFHIGAAVHTGSALRLFEASARVLRPGGELWTVFNTHLAYTDALSRIVGPTRVVDRNAKFTVTASERGSEGVA